MNWKTTKVFLLSVLFCLALFSIAAISTGFPVNFSGDPVAGGHPNISSTSDNYLCGDPVEGGHPCSNQSA